MKTSPETRRTERALRVQRVASRLTAPMVNALLNAQGTVDRDGLTGEVVADYCPGHESLRGDRMGASDYCEGSRVCKQAVDGYRAERTPDPDVLHVRKSDAVKIGTVCALIDRHLLENAPIYDEHGWPQHALTEFGRDVHIYLQAMREDGRL